MVAYPSKDEDRELADALKKLERENRAAVQCLAGLFVFIGGLILSYAYWQAKGLGWYLVAVGVAIFVLVAVAGKEEGESDGR